MLIRPAVTSEAPLLTALVMRSKAYWGYSREFLEQAAPELTVSEPDIADGKVSVAELARRRVGVSILDLADPPELVALFVEPEAIGKGIGRALLRHALERARGAGTDSVLIESDPNAESFYRAHGAIEIGRRRSPTTGRDLTLLRLPIEALTANRSLANRRH
jgi:GNAT superfamily N-acetyltransferase